MRHLVSLMLVIFTGTALAQQDSFGETRVRRIEVGGDSTEPPVILVRPGVSTILLFNAALARDEVELEGRESFQWVEVGDHSISLVPSESFRPGTRLRLTVRFADDAAGLGAVFHLEISSSRAERQVEIDRLSPSCDRCTRQLREAQEEARQCHEASQRGRLLACETEGLTGLLAAGLMDARGVLSMLQVTQSLPRGSERWIQVVAFRSNQRVAVWLEVHFSEGDEPWRLEQLNWVDGKRKPLGVSRAWSFTSPSTGKNTFVLERNVGPKEVLAEGGLVLWEANGTNRTLLWDLRFPQMHN